MEMKVKSFVTRYFNYRVDEITNAKISEAEKNERLKKLYNIYFLHQIGEITINECMRELSLV